MSKFQVTLKQLRDARACFNGYNKLVASISGKPLVEGNKYAVFDSDEPISIIQILDSNGLDDAIWSLRCIKDADSEARLFAVWCVRQIQYLLTDARSLTALDVAERFAYGLATREELQAAANSAVDAAANAANAAAANAANAAYAAAYAAAAVAANAAAASAAAASAANAAANAVHVASINAAYSAAYSAARASCVAAQETQFRKMLNGV